MGPVRLTVCGGGQHRTGLGAVEGPRTLGGGPGGQAGLGFGAMGPRSHCWLPSGAVRGPGFSVLPASSRNPKVGKVLMPQVNGNRKVKMKVSDA